MSHTSGPWSYCEHSWAETGIYADGRRIALLNIEPYATEETQEVLEEEASDNAKLITSSPQMFSAFVKIAEWADKGRHEEDFEAIAKLARAMIVEATEITP